MNLGGEGVHIWLGPHGHKHPLVSPHPTLDTVLRGEGAMEGLQACTPCFCEQRPLKS